VILPGEALTVKMTHELARQLAARSRRPITVTQRDEHSGEAML
jgi:hypothetical protein